MDELSTAYDRPKPALDRKLMSFLQSYRWPGNVRQLRNCVESMFVLADSSTLTIDDLPETICTEKPEDTARIEFPESFTLEDVERAVVCQTLDRCRGNRTQAANLLGISVRTLQRRLKKWDNGEQ